MFLFSSIHNFPKYLMSRTAMVRKALLALRIGSNLITAIVVGVEMAVPFPTRIIETRARAELVAFGTGA